MKRQTTTERTNKYDLDEAIMAQLSILCGLSIGYPDPDFPANKLIIGRNPVENNVVIAGYSVS